MCYHGPTRSRPKTETCRSSPDCPRLSQEPIKLQRLKPITPEHLQVLVERHLKRLGCHLASIGNGPGFDILDGDGRIVMKSVDLPAFARTNKLWPDRDGL
jgi:hypothetical protein